MSKRVSITINSELFDDPVQEASVRANLTIQALIQETLQEFNLSEGQYKIKLDGTPLDPQRTLEELDINTGASLAFEREQQQFQQMTRSFAAASSAEARRSLVVQPNLKEVQTGTSFKLRKHPALIGRPDANQPGSEKLLEVDVDPLPNSQTVSRKHASIHYEKEQFFLEGLSSRNPTFLNEQPLQPGERYVLKSGDMIRVGKIIFRFDLP